jgi:hypothetical protein
MLLEVCFNNIVLGVLCSSHAFTSIGLSVDSRCSLKAVLTCCYLLTPTIIYLDNLLDSSVGKVAAVRGVH